MASSLFELETLLYHCRLITEASAAMSRAPQAKQLTAEMALIRLCDARLTTDPDAIASRISILEDKCTMLSMGKVPVSVHYAAEGAKVQNAGASGAGAEEKGESPAPQISGDAATADVKEKLTAFTGWDDVIARVSNRNQAASGFLKACACYHSDKSGRMILLVKDAFSKQWLSRRENTELLYEALVCSGAPISDPTDIEFRIRADGGSGKDAMDDFDL